MIPRSDEETPKRTPTLKRSTNDGLLRSLVTEKTPKTFVGKLIGA